MTDLDTLLHELGLIKGTIDEGFKGSHRRHDVANGRLAKLEDRVDNIEKNEIRTSGVISTNTSERENFRLTSTKWTDRLVMFVLNIIGILALALLIKSGIINLWTSSSSTT